MRLPVPSLDTALGAEEPEVTMWLAVPLPVLVPRCHLCVRTLSFPGYSTEYIILRSLIHSNGASKYLYFVFVHVRST